MVQIINDPGRAAKAGFEFGSGFGNTLASLAQNKVEEVLERNQSRQGAKRLMELGVDQPWANYINSLPANQQLQMLMNYGQLASQNQQQQPQMGQQFQQQLNPIEQFSQNQSSIQPSGLAELSRGLGLGQPRNASDLLTQQQPISEILKNALAQTPLPQQMMGQNQQSSFAPSPMQQMPQQQPQVPTPQEQQPNQPRRPIRVQDFAGPQGAQPIKEDLNRLKFENAQQEKIEKLNAPVLKEIDTAYKNASEIRGTAQRMLELVDSGNVASSTSLRALLPEQLQTAETQEFDSKAKELATKLAAQLGVPTNAKIKISEGQKPNIKQRTEVQRRLLEEIIKKTEEPIKKFEIKEELLQSGPQPKNISTEINQRYKQLSSPQQEQGAQVSVGESFSSLNDIIQAVPEGTVFQDDSGRTFIKQNGKAIKYQGS